MSETGQNRFEIDLDEIERQLRRSAELGPANAAPPADPLAELARIVGQDDPFMGILGETKRPQGAGERREPTLEPLEQQPVPPLPRSQADPILTAEDRGVLGTAPLRGAAPSEAEVSFDPVARSYGADAPVFDTDEFAPMEPRRSRRRLGAVMALLALTAVGAAGAFTWRNMGGNFVSSGPPPLIKADNAPLKVAPENPGGMDIPNQNRQIYEGRSDSGRSRVLDRQEQPIDVREMARQMPPPEAPAAVVAPAAPPPIASPGPAAQNPAGSGVNTTVAALPPPPAAAPAAPAAPRNSALNALGEPRRVRTVAVRPDGSAIGASGGVMVSDPNIPILPTGELPPPVSVATTAIPANAAVLPQAVPAAGAAADGSTPATTATPIQVLPPSRPTTVAAAGTAPTSAEQTPGSLFAAADSGRPEAAAAQPGGGNAVAVRPPARPSRIGQQVAATDSIAQLPEGQASAPPGTPRTYSVQLAVRPTEDAARTAYDQLADKFATDLGGKPATVTQAQVNGRSVFRVRVTPLSREDANTLCTRLKASGGQCFVAAN
jgi:hypothetical protein